MSASSSLLLRWQLIILAGRGGVRLVAQERDPIKQATSVPDRIDAEILEIIRRQVW
jgi:hypothetical protein